MENINRAVALTSDVPKSTYQEDQFWIIYPEMFRKIHNKIDSKRGACRAVLLYLIMQEQNGKFHPAERTVLNACNLSHASYYKARDWLVEQGFLDYTPFHEIKINYKKIME